MIPPASQNFRGFGYFVELEAAYRHSPRFTQAGFWLRLPWASPSVPGESFLSSSATRLSRSGNCCSAMNCLLVCRSAASVQFPSLSVAGVRDLLAVSVGLSRRGTLLRTEPEALGKHNLDDPSPSRRRFVRSSERFGLSRSLFRRHGSTPADPQSASQSLIEPAP